MKLRYLFVAGLLLGALLQGCASNQDMIEIETNSEMEELEEEIVVTGMRASLADDELSEEEPAPEKPRLVIETELAELPVWVLNNRWSQEFNHRIFKEYGVNPTVVAEARPVSTFAMDVDTGSFQLALANLRNDRMPNAAGIRTEEFVNAFRYQYQSTDGVFSLSAEAAPSPFRAGYHVLHLGIQAKEVANVERLPLNIVLLADVSGSMADENKLELLKEAFKVLVSRLGKQDRVSLVSYSNNAKVRAKNVPAHKKRELYRIISKLRTEGSTNVEAGLRTAYALAKQYYEPGLVNRVVLTSDGMANVGASAPEAILREISEYRDQEIYLTTVGVGIGMYNDWIMEQLANKGDGAYLHISDKHSIRSSFVDNFVSQMHVVAKNAKTQVEFNSEVVSHYRLLGYENRALKKEDFLDAEKDGGELGAGHRVTAIYEIKLKEGKKAGDLGILRVAWQAPNGENIQTMEKPLPISVLKHTTRDASSDFKLSLAAALFAEKLRQTYWSSAYDYLDIADLVRELPGSYLRSRQVEDFKEAIFSARELDDRISPFDIQVSIDKYGLDHVPLLQ